MPGRPAWMRLGWFVLASVVIMLAVDGGISRTEALDRWVGTAVLSADGQSILVDFIVLVNPGVSASWEWRLRNRVIGSGPLAADVSGSTVRGTLFFTGGLLTQDPLCCRACIFSGTIAGNSANGTYDSSTCGGDNSTWSLAKQ